MSWRFQRFAALLLGALASVALAPRAWPAQAAPAESLIVFVRSGASALDQRFQAQNLPELRALASEMGLELQMREVAEGLPADVHITPLIVYQNHRGRSIYQGRYTTLTRLRNFVRTARHVPQGQDRLVREDTLAWRSGQAILAAPLKLTELAGELPQGHDPSLFRTQALEALYSGFERLQLAERIELGRADRSFYLDVHPHRSADGRLSVSLAIFSQFHCKKPVFQRFEQALSGPWEERNAVLARAAVILEQALFEQLKDPDGGDGFDPVPADIERSDWDALGMALPTAPAGQSTAAGDVPLVRRWVLPAAPEGAPARLFFRFPAPLDSYTGEVQDLTAELELPADLRLARAAGRIEVQAARVTMGDPDLDEMLRSSMALNVRKHPTAGFRLESLASEGRPLAYGELTQAQAHGTFEMKGISIPLDVRASFEPVLSPEGQPRLVVEGAFSIRLGQPFEIDGPDGPAPANDTLLFDFSFELEPERDQG